MMLWFLAKVLMVIGALVLIGIVYLVFKVRAVIKQSKAHVEQHQRLGVEIFGEARLRLKPMSEADSAQEIFANAFGPWADLGFIAAGDYFSESQQWRIGLRRADGLAVLVSAESSVLPCTLFALSNDKKFIGLTVTQNPAFLSVDRNQMQWQSTDALPDEAIAAFLRMRGEQPCFTLDQKTARTVIEKAYAAWMDLRLSEAPSETMIRQRAAALKPPLTEDEIKHSIEWVRNDWHEQLRQALLDHYQLQTKPDALTWQRLESGMIVVHALMSPAEVGELFNDELDEQRIAEIVEQQRSPFACFELLNAERPAVERRKLLAEVQRPVLAKLYVPEHSLEQEPNEDQLHQQLQNPQTPMQLFLYQAQSGDGELIEGQIRAQNSADGLQRLRDQGLRDARIVSEPMPWGKQTPFDAQSAKVAVQSMFEPLHKMLGLALLSNWWIWLPPLLLVAYSFYQINSLNAPLTWGDYTIYGYAAIAFIVMVFVVGPMVFYDRLQRAMVIGRYREARWMAKLLIATNVTGLVANSNFHADIAKTFAGEGEHQKALNYWKGWESKIGPAEYVSRLQGIYWLIGDRENVLRATKQSFDLDPNSDIARVDYVLTLLRLGGTEQVQTAEQMLVAIVAKNLSALPLAGFHYAQGLSHFRAQRFGPALSKFQVANEGFSEFSIPLMQSFVAEVSCYSAVALLALNRRDEAQAAWQGAELVMRQSPLMVGLVDDYQRRLKG